MTLLNDIPLAETREFQAKAKSCALIVGVYNEGAKFTRQLAQMQAYRDQVDLIVADGGSTDGSTSPEALTGKVRALLINRDIQRGLSVQYRAALHYALMQGYDYFIMVDGNGKDGMDAIPRFVAKLQEGFDFVQGSRFLPGGQHENTPIDRVLGIRYVFNPIMHLGSGFSYTDAMNGFKGCSRTMLADPRVQPFRAAFVRYSLQYYFNYIAPRLGLRIAEIPVTRSYPADGGPYSKIGGVTGRIKILGELFNTITGRYNV